MQKGNFDARDFTYTVDFTNSNGTTASASHDYTYVAQCADCMDSTIGATYLNLMSDTLKTVTIQQESNGTPT